jgi:hypothetical protein
LDPIACNLLRVAIASLYDPRDQWNELVDRQPDAWAVIDGRLGRAGTPAR